MKIIKRAFSLAALCLLSALTPLPAGAYEAVNVKIPVNCVDVTDRESQTYTIRTRLRSLISLTIYIVILLYRTPVIWISQS